MRIRKVFVISIVTGAIAAAGGYGIALAGSAENGTGASRAAAAGEPEATHRDRGHASMMGDAMADADARAMHRAMMRDPDMRAMHRRHMRDSEARRLHRQMMRGR